MVTVGVLAFGAVLGWWAASLVVWRSLSRTAFGGVVASISSAAALVILLSGVGTLGLFIVGVVIGAAGLIIFLAATTRSTTWKGSP